MRISVIGLGYVGLVTSACLAEWGHSVIGTDANVARRDALRRGAAPFYEPGLNDLVQENVATGRLSVADNIRDAIAGADMVIVAVGTHDGNGGWQTTTMLTCMSEVVPLIGIDTTLVIRSTLPPEFVGRLGETVTAMRGKLPPISVILNPEFTREGSALQDFLHPERIIVGIVDDHNGSGAGRIQELYKDAVSPILIMPAIDAVFAKLGSNLFLATKISFANDLARLCSLYGSDIGTVVGALALDSRIGGSFLRAGVGFGGSCLPHQVIMTTEAAARHGIDVPLFAAVDVINHRQRDLFVEMLSDGLKGEIRGARIAILGLSFKPNTDDLRDAPSLTIARHLVALGARPVAYDPISTTREAAAAQVPGLEIASSVEAAITGAHAIGLVTEWPEFLGIDWIKSAPRMNGHLVVDGRNALDADALIAAGFEYVGFGRRGPGIRLNAGVTSGEGPVVPTHEVRGSRQDVPA